MVKLLVLAVIVGLFGSSQAGPDCTKPPALENVDPCCKCDNAAYKAAEQECKKSVGEQNLPQVPAAMCVAECIFNKMDILKDGELDFAKLKAVLAKEADTEVAGNVEKIFTTCAPRVSNILAKIPNLADGKCKPYSGALRMCVGAEAIITCPPAKWTDSPQCNTLREYVKACPIGA